MNESITIEVREKGQLLPFSEGPDGITVGPASDVPSKLQQLGVSPGNEIVRGNLKRLLHINNLAGLSLTPSIDQGRLRLTSAGTLDMPEGAYNVDIGVSHLELDEARETANISRGANSTVVFDVKPEKYTFRFTDNIKPGDSTERILHSGESRVDGKPLVDWLNDPDPRIVRKACLLNLLSKLRTDPKVSASFADAVQSIIFADIDRIYAKVDSTLRRRFENEPGLGRRDGTIHHTHLRLLDHVDQGDRDGYTLHSYRNGEFKSLQFVIAEHSDASKPSYADIDVDLGNPFASLGGMIVHIGELLDPRPTNHIALYNDFKNSDFCYYKLEKASGQQA